MLQRHKLRETENGFMVLAELEDTPCYLCGGESVANPCPGDGGWHHHGCVHTPDGGLKPVCAECIVIVKGDWASLRATR